MIVLGIETAGPESSVALFRSEGPTASVALPVNGRLGAELAPAIQRLLQQEGLGAQRPPDLVAVNVGPGSYTGLRIGIAAAKGLAFAWGRPLIGVPAVEALSAEAPPQAERVLCALDASRGQVYAVLFTRQNGRIQRRAWEDLVSPADLRDALGVGVPTVVIGDAAEHIADGAEIEAAGRPWPTAERIARLALRRHLAGERQDPLQLVPIYYRPNEAEEQRRQRKMRSVS